jgi:hypothetical protein
MQMREIFWCFLGFPAIFCRELLFGCYQRLLNPGFPPLKRINKHIGEYRDAYLQGSHHQGVFEIARNVPLRIAIRIAKAREALPQNQSGSLGVNRKNFSRLPFPFPRFLGLSAACGKSRKPTNFSGAMIVARIEVSVSDNFYRRSQLRVAYR